MATALDSQLPSTSLPAVQFASYKPSLSVTHSHTQKSYSVVNLNQGSPPQDSDSPLCAIAFPDDAARINQLFFPTSGGTSSSSKCSSIFYVGAPPCDEAMLAALTNSCKVYQLVLGSSGTFSFVPKEDSLGSFTKIFCPNATLAIIDHCSGSPDISALASLITSLAEDKLTPKSSSHCHLYQNNALSPIKKWSWKKEGKNALILLLVGLATVYIFKCTLPGALRRIAAVATGAFVLIKGSGSL